MLTGLSHEENLRKMRMLTFIQMAENKKELDYSLVQQELNLEENEMEDFIIDSRNLFIHYVNNCI